GGHPLFLTERLRARAGERLEEAILSRCHAATFAAQRLLEAASVFERPFRPGLLTVMLGDEAAPVSDVEDLLARRLLLEHEGLLSFPHDLVRQTVYSSVSAPRREVLHRRALRALGSEGGPVAELANHAQAAGGGAAPVGYATGAGETAAPVFAQAQAGALPGLATRTACFSACSASR